MYITTHNYSNGIFHCPKSILCEKSCFYDFDFHMPRLDLRKWNEQNGSMKSEVAMRLKDSFVWQNSYMFLGFCKRIILV